MADTQNETELELEAEMIEVESEAGDTRPDAAIEAEEHRLGAMPLRRLMFFMSVPLMLSLLVQVLYGLIDSLYIAQISNMALTAFSLCTPIQYFITGLGLGVSVGANAALSKRLGAKHTEGVNQTVGNSLLITWFCTVFFIIAGIFIVPLYLDTQTDITEVQNMSISYGMVIAIFAAGSLHQVLMEYLLAATGRTGRALISMACGAIINIVLDPLLIFGLLGFPEMGMTGAAVGTVISQWIAAAIAFILNHTANDDIEFSVAGLVPQRKLIWEIIKLGAPVALGQCLTSVIAAVMNSILLGLSSLAPAVYAVYTRLQSFFTVPAHGIYNAEISIIGYNLGAQNKRRIVRTLEFGLLINTIIALIGVVICLVIPGVLLTLFNSSEDMSSIGDPALRIVAFALLFSSTTQVLMGFIQVLGKHGEGFILLGVQVVLLLLSAWLLSFSQSAVLVWLAFPITETLRCLLAFIFTAVIYRRHIRNLPSPGKIKKSMKKGAKQNAT